jgi:hypothetical protein
MFYVDWTGSIFFVSGMDGMGWICIDCGIDWKQVDGAIGCKGTLYIYICLAFCSFSLINYNSPT